VRHSEAAEDLAAIAAAAVRAEQLLAELGPT
jgi:hypothetical protein